jgi:hypothetical protein
VTDLRAEQAAPRLSEELGLQTRDETVTKRSLLRVESMGSVFGCPLALKDPTDTWLLAVCTACAQDCILVSGVFSSKGH